MVRGFQFAWLSWAGLSCDRGRRRPHPQKQSPETAGTRSAAILIVKFRTSPAKLGPVLKTTTLTLRKLKGQRLIVATTAYDVITARFAAEAGVDVILVGDSVGNNLLGFDSTIPVTLDMMAHHTAAVARARPEALIAADVPFGEAHFDYERVLAGCQRLRNRRARRR